MLAILMYNVFCHDSFFCLFFNCFSTLWNSVKSGYLGISDLVELESLKYIYIPIRNSAGEYLHHNNGIDQYATVLGYGHLYL